MTKRIKMHQTLRDFLFFSTSASWILIFWTSARWNHRRIYLVNRKINAICTFLSNVFNKLKFYKLVENFGTPDEYIFLFKKASNFRFLPNVATRENANLAIYFDRYLWNTLSFKIVSYSLQKIEREGAKVISARPARVSQTLINHISLQMLEPIPTNKYLEN